MTVYVIVQLKINDRAAYDRYQARFFGVFKKFNGRLLSADENPKIVEGTWDRDKLVLMSFPDEAAYRAWADSPEYLEISRDRKAGASPSSCWRRDLHRAPDEHPWLPLRPKTDAEEKRYRHVIRIRPVIDRPVIIIGLVIRTISVASAGPVAMPRA